MSYGKPVMVSKSVQVTRGSRRMGSRLSDGCVYPVVTRKVVR